MRQFIYSIILPLFALSTYSTNTLAEDKIKLETTVIKGNTELPKVLYVVPWQDVEDDKNSQQKLSLHSLFGDFFEPVTPEAPHFLEK
ncbi:MAG: hypothetical protein K6L76_01335 [Agarilytica sp.]